MQFVPTRAMVVVGALGLTAFTCFPAIAAQPPVRVIAASGLPVLDQPGFVFWRGLGLPAINNAGQVTFQGTVLAPGASLPSSYDFFLGTSRLDLATIYHGNPPSPGGGGSSPDFAVPVINDNGTVAARYAVFGNGQGLMYRVPGSAATFTPIDTTSNSIFADRSLLALNNAGTVLLTPAGAAGGPAATSILRFNPGSGLGTFLNAGQPAPGGPGLTLQTFSVPLVNDGGSALFKADLVDASSAAAGSALYLGPSAGALQLIARTGDPAPSSPPGVTFGGFDSSPSLNSAGQALFVASLGDPALGSPRGIYRYIPGGGVSAVVREGDSLAVAGGKLGSISGGPVLTSNGKVVVQDHFRIYSGTSAGDFKAIAGTGIAAPPELPAGSSYEVYGLQPIVNNAGDVVFLARITGAPQATDLALFAWDPSAGLHMVLREGDAVEVAPGDIRTILPYDVPHNGSSQPAFAISGFTPYGGVNRTFADNGELAVLLYLTSPDASQAYSSAVVTIQVPEPSALAACVGLAVFGFMRRARR